MSTSWCGKNCKTLPNEKRKERRLNFYSRCSIVINMWLSYIYNTVPEQYNANIWVCAAHFTEDRFLILGESSLQCEHYEWPITTHRIAGQSEHTSLLRTMSFVKNWHVSERQRGNNNVQYVENNVFLNLEPRKQITLHQIHKIMFFSATYDPFKHMVIAAN